MSDLGICECKYLESVFSESRLHKSPNQATMRANGVLILKAQPFVIWDVFAKIQT
jgi:hypothetical protein